MAELELEEATIAPPVAMPSPAPTVVPMPSGVQMRIGNRAMRDILEDQYAFMSARARGLRPSGNIIRRLQSLFFRGEGLAHNFVGLECNTVAALYMLQSYGLVPPDMRLEEFEDAFTPVNVEASISSRDSARSPRNNVVRVNGVEMSHEGKAVLGLDMITPVLAAVTSADQAVTNRRLRGGSHDSALISASRGAEVLRRLLIAFAELPRRRPEYRFLQDDKTVKSALRPGSPIDIAERRAFKPYDPATMQARPYEGGDARRLIGPKSQVKNLSAAVANGLVPEAYFTAGHTIYAGINENNQMGGVTHYVLITGVAHRGSFQGRPYTIYEADDPLFGRIYLVAPYLPISTFEGMPGLGKDPPWKTYRAPGGERRTLFLFANLAFGVDAPELHPR